MKSGMEGDCGMLAPYGGRVPLTRSGESGKRGVPGEFGNLNGGRSIFFWILCSNSILT